MFSVVQGGAEEPVIKGLPKEGWYRITTFVIPGDGSQVNERLESEIVSEADVAAAMEVDIEWLNCQEYGEVYSSPSLGDDSLWIHLTKYPNYLKVVF